MSQLINRENIIYCYVISGLTVRSELELVGLVPRTEVMPEAVVNISKGRVVVNRAAAIASGPNWFITADAFLFEVPGMARICVSQGSEIRGELLGSDSDAAVVPFILSTGMGAVLHQRGVLPLHASVVAGEQSAIAFCGPTGIGKSTLCAAFCLLGYRFVADDIAAIGWKQQVPTVASDSRKHRLWSDVIAALDLSQRQAEPVRQPIQKYHVEPDSVMMTEQVPLKTVVILKAAEFRFQKAGLQLLQMADATAHLREVVYRPALAERMNREAALFAQIAGLLPHVAVYKLTRPKELDTLSETTQFLHQALLGGKA
jgi:hypothetical protein